MDIIYKKKYLKYKKKYLFEKNKLLEVINSNQIGGMVLAGRMGMLAAKTFAKSKAMQSMALNTIKGNLSNVSLPKSLPKLPKLPKFPKSLSTFNKLHSTNHIETKADKIQKLEEELNTKIDKILIIVTEINNKLNKQEQ
jgi:hypothetical protein